MATPHRRRTTSARVRWIDRLTGIAIRAGGLGVIVCVLGIFVFLAVVVLPLFQGASLDDRRDFELLPAAATADLLFAEIDEYRALGLLVLRSGEARWFSARTGHILGRQGLFASDPPLSAFRRLPGGDGFLALGFADGTVRVGRVGFSTRFLDSGEVTPELALLAGEQTHELPEGVVQHTPEGKLRLITPLLELDPPVAMGAPDTPVLLVDYRNTASSERLVVIDAQGRATLNEIERRENLLTGEVTREVRASALPVPAELASLGPAAHVLLTSGGDQLYLGWSDGRVGRYDLRDPSTPALAEVADLVAPTDRSLTAMRFTSGEQSILAGDSAGQLRAWFRVEWREAIPLPSLDPASEGAGAGRPGLGSSDGYRLVAAHAYTPEPAAVAVLAVSTRDKSFLAGDADGTVSLHHLTTEELRVRTRVGPAQAGVVAAQITPKGDGVFVVLGDGRAALWQLGNPHPEVTLSSLLGPVWYEGSPSPSYTWQSSSGTDDFEPKLSLVPLIFGTLKATFYSMLFAVPVALLAAIYTAEFLDRRWRTPLKTSIEVMASLPSVVLGFIAALVLAPVIESWVMAVLAAFALVPLTVLGFGYLWQAMPPGLQLRWAGRPQFVLLLAVVVLALLAASRLALPLESLLFAGDFKAWLDGRAGSGAPGIALLAWPLLLLAVLVLDRQLLVPLLGRRLRGWSRRAAARLELGKYAALVAASLVGAWGVAAAGTLLGIDPRGEIFGTYAQRNALLVGFVMGFAVIPIIYTIAEDALTAVPRTLRSASLGCGATRWQTATRVVLPVALSGIFSALMVGLGRAVGETMIVLMAAGNTPLLDFNVFNGLRTLSANIAVELPEAVKGGTLYRVLFLAAFSLFCLTFVVNTLAERIRQRFRRRAFQL